jgi:hypothetical protein
VPHYIETRELDIVLQNETLFSVKRGGRWFDGYDRWA